MKHCRSLYYLCAFMMTISLWPAASSAQTDIDAVMMRKNNLCIGPMYGYSSWKNYWEGSLKRTNENIGTVSSSMFSIMGNYGITDKLNVMFGLPYITTKASAGQLKGQKGLQDLSFWIKWEAAEKKIGRGDLALFLIGGYSLPVSDYIADYLPLSIGLRGNNVSLRLMADYQFGKWFTTASSTYVRRSNINIDRNAYYTTEMHYTNEVEMPDVIAFNARAGYRYKELVAEAFFDNSTTQGGFDITRNNMPFPSNKMTASRIGINFKYETPFVKDLFLTGNAATTIAGRNMGQSTGFNAGVFYVIGFTGKSKTTSVDQKK